MGRIVKPKVDALLGSKLSNESVLVTGAWRAYKTYAKEKDLNIIESNQIVVNTLLRACTTSKMSMVSILV